MDAAGVDFGVVVHPEPYQDDHRYLEHCLAVGKGRLKGTCLFFADRAWKQELPALVKRAGGGIVALRVHAYAPDRLPPFGSPELRAMWKAAMDLGLAIQVHLEPRYAPALEPFIKEFTATPVIIDHLGRPFQGTPDEHAVVVRWSRFPHTIMKLSAVPPQEQYPHRDVRPIIASLVSAFGPTRLISGGGFSNAESKPETYRKSQEKLRSFVAHVPAAQQQAIFGGNAARIFRLGA
jgi:predicted TIM-barrel fold metal-dependent hydrolase